MYTRMPHFHLFGNFPEDIRRTILEIAFEDSYPRANHLALLSREIHSWIQPLVHRCVSLSTLDRNGEGRFLHFIDIFRYGSRGKEFYSTSTKIVFIDDFLFQNFALEFLPFCKNLVSLSCWPNPRSWSTPLTRQASNDAITAVLNPETFPYLRKLSIPILQTGPLLEFDVFNNSLAQNLTHLDLLLGSELPWDGLKHMACLRYISVQPVIDLWLAPGYIEGSRQLRMLAERIIPFFPQILCCFVIWLPTFVIMRAAHEDTRRKLQSQDPLFASLFHGWLDSRIVLASFADREPVFDQGIPDHFRNEVRDALAQTVLLVNGEFDLHLIWDNSAGQGGDLLLWSIEQLLYRRKQADFRARNSHWHQGCKPEEETVIHVPSPAVFSLFNEFPEDIRRLVFEIAFDTSATSAIHLALVSREVHSWVKPLIYRRIVLCHVSSPELASSFINSVCHGREGKSHYAALIQSLSIDKVALYHLGNDFLLSCANVLSFAGSWSKWGSEARWDDVLRSILKGDMLPQLKRLSLQDVVLADIFIHPVCQSLTHLDICLNGPTSWAGLETLRSLKHIRVDALNQIPIRDDPVEASRDVREFIHKAVLHFPLALESFVFCVDPAFALAAAIMDCDSKIVRGGPAIFTDIVRGGIDRRVVLSCKSSPLTNWSDQRISQRQIDEIYDFLNQVVLYSLSFLPWDNDDDPAIHQHGCHWLDIVKNIIRRRKNESGHQGARLDGLCQGKEQLA